MCLEEDGARVWKEICMIKDEKIFFKKKMKGFEDLGVRKLSSVE